MMDMVLVSVAAAAIYEMQFVKTLAQAVKWASRDQIISTRQCSSPKLHVPGARCGDVTVP
jgi:hypothetical protein